MSHKLYKHSNSSRAT